MTNCLLIAATPLEIEPFIRWYGRHAGEVDAEVDILISGVGMLPATWSIVSQLQMRKPDIILQAGIAGSFDKRAFPGSIFTVSSEVIADMGVMEKGQLRSAFDLKLIPENKAPFKKGKLANPHKKLLQQAGLPAVSAVTVNQVTTQPAMIRQYIEKYAPVLESMEGAALHYAALQAGIPFLQIRSVSNYAGVRDKKKWKLRESVEILNHTLISLVTTLKV